MTALRRCGVVGQVLVAVMVASSTAAFAHIGGQIQPDAAFYRTSLSELAPRPAGISVRVDPAGEWIELTNTGPDEVVILGYTLEPYLRVTAARVDENMLSPSTYLNRSLFADSVPAGSDPGSVAPSWRQIGSTGTVRWHDHRIHWMGENRPPVVNADPRHPHLVGTWTVHATVGGEAFLVNGELRWIGKPDSANGNQPIPTWLLTLLEVLAVAVIVLTVLILRLRRRVRAATPGQARPSRRERIGRLITCRRRPSGPHDRGTGPSRYHPPPLIILSVRQQRVDRRDRCLSNAHRPRSVAHRQQTPQYHEAIRYTPPPHSTAGRVRCPPRPGAGHGGAAACSSG